MIPLPDPTQSRVHERRCARPIQCIVPFDVTTRVATPSKLQVKCTSPVILAADTDSDSESDDVPLSARYSEKHRNLWPNTPIHWYGLSVRVGSSRFNPHTRIQYLNLGHNRKLLALMLRNLSRPYDTRMARSIDADNDNIHSLNCMRVYIAVYNRVFLPVVSMVLDRPPVVVAKMKHAGLPRHLPPSIRVRRLHRLDRCIRLRLLSTPLLCHTIETIVGRLGQYSRMEWGE